jgi:hypothetical protein
MRFISVEPRRLLAARYSFRNNSGSFALFAAMRRVYVFGESWMIKRTRLYAARRFGNEQLDIALNYPLRGKGVKSRCAGEWPQAVLEENDEHL